STPAAAPRSPFEHPRQNLLAPAGSTTGASLGPVEAGGEAEPRVDAEPAQWLRLPRRRAVPDPRQARELGVETEDQVGERASREIAGTDAVADVAPRPR